MEPSWKLPSGAQKVAETHAWEPGCCGEQTPRCRRLVTTGQNCREVIPLGVAPGACPCRLPGMSPYPPRLVPSRKHAEVRDRALQTEEENGRVCAGKSLGSLLLLVCKGIHTSVNA